MEKTTYTIVDFLEWQRQRSLDLQPYYQRRSVWNPRVRSLLIDSLLSAGRTAPAETQQHNDYLTRREVAALCRVPLSTFDSLRRHNRFPFPDALMGKHMLRRASTVTAFLDASARSFRPPGGSS